MKKTFYVFTAVLVVVFSVSCSSTPQVSRVDAGAQIDLSGSWNDTDVRLVCKNLVAQCLEAPGVSRVIKDMKRAPTIVVGKFKNDSSEHIDTEIITTNMSSALIADGSFDFIAGGEALADLTAERNRQDDLGLRETNGNDLLGEIGADFQMRGSVKTMIDKAGNQTVRTYFVTAELMNVSTGRIIWQEQNSEIKKVIVQPKNKL